MSIVWFQDTPFIFRLLRPDEAPAMFDLIMGRVAWMDEVGIRQWNVTKYDECYPESYYRAHAEAGRVYCLEETRPAGTAEGAAGENSAGEDPAGRGALLAVGLLLEEDERWPDGVPREDAAGQTVPAADAYYLHHFATAVGSPKGVGGTFLQALEDCAAEQGKEWFRLDSADDNETLETYYTARGYEPAGACVDGLYTGVLRQKRLRPS